MLNIGINGLGRIGRLVLRKIIEDNNKDFNIVAVNDLCDIDNLVYLIKYDSAQTFFDKEIKVDKKNKTLFIDGNKISIFSEKNPKQLPWKNLEVDLVLECTGIFRTKELASQHLEAGAQKVLISAPSGKEIKTIVYGVNEKILSKEDTIISAASCTTNCLAPMLKTLHDNFEVLNGIMITIHAFTNDQSLLDTMHKDFRRGRCACNNIVPTSTGAAKAIGQVIPELDGILNGAAQRVPTLTGSLTEFIGVIRKNATSEEINECMKLASNKSFGFLEDPIVSSDIIGSSYGSLFDPTLTIVNNANNLCVVKVSSWYDNEMSYVSQLIRLVKYWSEL